MVLICDPVIPVPGVFAREQCDKFLCSPGYTCDTPFSCGSVGCVF